MTTDSQIPEPNEPIQDENEAAQDSTLRQPTDVAGSGEHELTEGAGETVPSESDDATAHVSDTAVAGTTDPPNAETPADSSDSAQSGQEQPESSAETSASLAVAASPEASQPAAQGDQQDDDDDDEEYEEDEYEEEDDEDEVAQHGRMSLFDHLRELKKRIMRAFLAICVGFVICYAFAEELFNFLVRPLLAVLPKGSKLIYTGLPEAFFTYMKVAFVAGCFLASPVVFYQIWAFIAPGLYDEEKRHILPTAIFSAVFFILGGAFAYFIAFPFAFEFFMSYSTDIIEAQPRLTEYLSFALQLLFAFGLVFELPLFTFFLAKMGIITAADMRKFRRYAILGNFILAAILTPPDVMSQLLMAAPLLLLYEISILVAQAFGKKSKDPAPQAAESADDPNDDEDDDDGEDDEDETASEAVTDSKPA